MRTSPRLSAFLRCSPRNSLQSGPHLLAAANLRSAGGASTAPPPWMGWERLNRGTVPRRMAGAVAGHFFLVAPPAQQIDGEAEQLRRQRGEGETAGGAFQGLPAYCQGLEF